MAFMADSAFVEMLVRRVLPMKELARTLRNWRLAVNPEAQINGEMVADPTTNGFWFIIKIPRLEVFTR